MRILIADDQSSVHTYLSAVVSLFNGESDSFELFHAFDGEECLKLIEQQEPYLLFLDIRMPLLDGIGVLENLQKRNLRVPVVVILSAYGEFSYAQTALRLGVRDYLLKPIDRSNLTELITKFHTEYFQMVSHSLADFLVLHRPCTLPFSQFPFQHSSFYGLLTAPALTPELFQHFPVHFSLSDGRGFALVPAGDRPFFSKPCELAAYSAVHDLESITDVQKSFDESKQTYELKSFYADFPAEPMQQETSSLEQLPQQIASALLTRNSGVLSASIFHLFNHFAVEQTEPEECKNRTIRILLNMMKHLPAETIQQLIINDMLDMEVDLYECLIQCETLQALHSVFQEMLQPKPASTKEDSFSPSIQEIQQYLSEHFAEALTLESLGQHFYISKYELCRRFKQSTGDNLWNYLTTIRIQYAKKLLDTTSLKIYEIAEASGFHSTTHFSNTFKKYTGIRPNHWNRS